MSKVYQRGYLFKNIDKILHCAEARVRYDGEKLVPFYFNPEKQIKLFQGDALVILKRIPGNCI
ncbi:MAG: hypothetical protein OEZ20_02640 [candidate division WOR-3 bacterium]|nr:hypothetical protein [candidate division WOR-3 bacterium]MDH5683343.1 hypothetical protein [candidate division WOR-3 bacterium]